MSPRRKEKRAKKGVKQVIGFTRLLPCIYGQVFNETLRGRRKRAHDVIMTEVFLDAYIVFGVKVLGPYLGFDE